MAGATASLLGLQQKSLREQGLWALRTAIAARNLCELPDRQHVISSLRAAVDTMAAAAEGTLEERIESDLDFMFASREKGVVNMGVDRHYDIVAAIETGDAVLARNTIREHMDTAADNLGVQLERNRVGMFPRPARPAIPQGIR